MTNDVNEAERIIGNVRQTRRIFEDVAALLRTAEKMLEKKGWIPESNTAITGASGVIALPKAWLPSTAFRFFANGKRPNLLAYVSVLLDDEVSGEYSLSAPLVSAGFFDFGDSKALDSNWEYWYSEWFAYSKWYGFERGEGEYPVIRMGPETGWKTRWKEAGANEVPFIAFACFAVPLTEIRTDSDVEAKVVLPLVAEL